MGKNSSYILSSILWGREPLKKGVGWKLGAGANINVWDDNWIPSITMFKPYVWNKHLYHDLCVANLIDQQTHTWNMQIIQSFVSLFDIPRITRIQSQQIGLLIH